MYNKCLQYCQEQAMCSSASSDLFNNDILHDIISVLCFNI